MDNVHSLSEFVKKAQNGNVEAFGKIYDLLLDRVYRFVYFRVNTKEDTTRRILLT